MKLGYKLLLSILTLTLFLGLTTTAWAADSEAQGGLLRGVVTTIAGDSLTVQSNRAEVTLLTDDETAFEVPGIKDASLADIATGDFVVIRAARSEAGPLARHVSVIPDGSLKDRTMRGIISAVDGAKFQLRTRRGQVTVNTNENTVFRIPKVEEATAADLEEKMPVIVMGQYEQEEQVFNASAVAVIPAKIVKRHMVRGKLSAIEGDTLVLTTGRDGSSYTVNDPAGRWSQVFRGGYGGDQNSRSGQGVKYGSGAFRSAVATSASTGLDGNNAPPGNATRSVRVGTRPAARLSPTKSTSQIAV